MELCPSIFVEESVNNENIHVRNLKKSGEQGLWFVLQAFSVYIISYIKAKYLQDNIIKKRYYNKTYN